MKDYKLIIFDWYGTLVDIVKDQPFAESFTVLDSLVKKGKTLAIVTSMHRLVLENSLKEHNLSRFFSTNRTASDKFVKPHADVIHSILEELNISSDDTLMVGDSANDLLMAKNANVDSVGITSGTEGKETLLKYSPIFCIDKIDQLLDILDFSK